MRADRSRVSVFALIILGLVVVARPAPAQEPANPVPPGALSRKLRHFVDDHVMAGAVVLVADREKVLALEAVGYADLAAKRPMRADDLFWIASMTKPITATALMMLVDEGKVRLDDPVEKYIPEFKSLRVKLKDGTLVAPSHPITVREILSHTSGMGFLNPTDKQKLDSVPLAESIRHDLLEPLLFDPGTQYKYSNEGTDTAGRIIEVVSGMPYEKFLQERLFTPLGMTDTTFNPSPAQLPRLAKTYQTNKAKAGLEEVPIHYLKQPLGGPGHFPAPGGGLFSTAQDVARFGQMLAGGGTFRGKTYLSRDAVRQMTTKQTGDSVKENYGLCFSVMGPDAFGHGGVYKTVLNVVRGQVQIFLTQQANPWSRGDPVAEFAAEARRVYPVAAAPGNRLGQ
jgi:CubicO group peptidase (beta-lactamase class C family)